MSAVHSNNQPFPGRFTLIAMIAAYFAALIGTGCAIWFEWPAAVALGLRVATLVLAVLAAICVGRAFTRSQESLTFRERSSTSGRGAGVLTLVALGTLAILGTKQISPRSWPTTVDQSLAMLDEQLDEHSKRKLARMGYDELSGLHEGWGSSIREEFGMWSGNEELLRDCDREYVHAETCSSVIISRYWKKLRAQLPPTELGPLKTLEAKLNRVILKPHEFKQSPLSEVVTFFNDAIHGQLPEDARFTIRYDAAHADKFVSWDERRPISLNEALGRLAVQTGLYASRTSPDLVLEPYWSALPVDVDRSRGRTSRTPELLTR